MPEGEPKFIDKDTLKDFLSTEKDSRAGGRSKIDKYLSSVLDEIISFVEGSKGKDEFREGIDKVIKILEKQGIKNEKQKEKFLNSLLIVEREIQKLEESERDLKNILLHLIRDIKSVVLIENIKDSREYLVGLELDPQKFFRSLDIEQIFDLQGSSERDRHREMGEKLSNFYEFVTLRNSGIYSDFDKNFEVGSDLWRKAKLGLKLERKKDDKLNDLEKLQIRKEMERIALDYFGDESTHLEAEINSVSKFNIFKRRKRIREKENLDFYRENLDLEYTIKDNLYKEAKTAIEKYLKEESKLGKKEIEKYEKKIEEISLRVSFAAFESLMKEISNIYLRETNQVKSLWERTKTILKSKAAYTAVSLFIGAGLGAVTGGVGTAMVLAGATGTVTGTSMSWFFKGRRGREKAIRSEASEQKDKFYNWWNGEDGSKSAEHTNEAEKRLRETLSGYIEVETDVKNILIREGRGYFNEDLDSLLNSNKVQKIIKQSLLFKYPELKKSKNKAELERKMVYETERIKMEMKMQKEVDALSEKEGVKNAVSQGRGEYTAADHIKTGLWQGTIAAGMALVSQPLPWITPISQGLFATIAGLHSGRAVYEELQREERKEIIEKIHNEFQDLTNKLKYSIQKLEKYKNDYYWFDKNNVEREIENVKKQMIKIYTLLHTKIDQLGYVIQDESVRFKSKHILKQAERTILEVKIAGTKKLESIENKVDSIIQEFKVELETEYKNTERDIKRKIEKVEQSKKREHRLKAIGTGVAIGVLSLALSYGMQEMRSGDGSKEVKLPTDLEDITPPQPPAVEVPIPEEEPDLPDKEVVVDGSKHYIDSDTHQNIQENIPHSAYVDREGESITSVLADQLQELNPDMSRGAAVWKAFELAVKGGDIHIIGPDGKELDWGDITRIISESDAEGNVYDKLRAEGCKIEETGVLLGDGKSAYVLKVDKDGNPIGYEEFHPDESKPHGSGKVEEEHEYSIKREPVSSSQETSSGGQEKGAVHQPSATESHKPHYHTGNQVPEAVPTHDVLGMRENVDLSHISQDMLPHGVDKNDVVWALRSYDPSQSHEYNESIFEARQKIINFAHKHPEYVFGVDENGVKQDIDPRFHSIFEKVLVNEIQEDVERGNYNQIYDSMAKLGMAEGLGFVRGIGGEQVFEQWLHENYPNHNDIKNAFFNDGKINFEKFLEIVNSFGKELISEELPDKDGKFHPRILHSVEIDRDGRGNISIHTTDDRNARAIVLSKWDDNEKVYRIHWLGEKGLEEVGKVNGDQMKELITGNFSNKTLSEMQRHYQQEFDATHQRVDIKIPTPEEEPEVPPAEKLEPLPQSKEEQIPPPPEEPVSHRAEHSSESKPAQAGSEEHQHTSQQQEAEDKTHDHQNMSEKELYEHAAQLGVESAKGANLLTNNLRGFLVGLWEQDKIGSFDEFKSVVAQKMGVDYLTSNEERVLHNIYDKIDSYKSLGFDRYVRYINMDVNRFIDEVAHSRGEGYFIALARANAAEHADVPVTANAQEITGQEAQDIAHNFKISTAEVDLVKSSAEIFHDLYQDDPDYIKSLFEEFNNKYPDAKFRSVDEMVKAVGKLRDTLPQAPDLDLKTVDKGEMKQIADFLDQKKSAISDPKSAKLYDFLFSKGFSQELFNRSLSSLKNSLSVN